MSKKVVIIIICLTAVFAATSVISFILYKRNSISTTLKEAEESIANCSCNDAMDKLNSVLEKDEHNEKAIMLKSFLEKYIYMEGLYNQNKFAEVIKEKESIEYPKNESISKLSDKITDMYQTSKEKLDLDKKFKEYVTSAEDEIDRKNFTAADKIVSYLEKNMDKYNTKKQTGKISELRAEVNYEVEKIAAAKQAEDTKKIEEKKKAEEDEKKAEEKRKQDEDAKKAREEAEKKASEFTYEKSIEMVNNMVNTKWPDGDVVASVYNDARVDENGKKYYLYKLTIVEWVEQGGSGTAGFGRVYEDGTFMDNVNP